ncbi:hypothetical protein [Paracoccus mutanolyticus]|uniref:hypothetical protein n=1 Tax=Paracoccus mutanolyticus TaxID=1499308 RepID=UPI0011AE2D34|nr:hypothetical protein [Paracoccus mutanolyticus]
MLTAADGTALELAGAERLLPIPDGGNISERWAMTDIAKGGLRRDRSFDFAADAPCCTAATFRGGRV